MYNISRGCCLEVSVNDKKHFGIQLSVKNQDVSVFLLKNWNSGADFFHEFY